MVFGALDFVNGEINLGRKEYRLISVLEILNYEGQSNLISKLRLDLLLFYAVINVVCIQDMFYCQTLSFIVHRSYLFAYI